MCIASYLRFGPSLASLATFFFLLLFPPRTSEMKTRFCLISHSHMHMHTRIYTHSHFHRLFLFACDIQLSFRYLAGETKARPVEPWRVFLPPLPLVPLVVVRHKGFAGDTGLFARDPLLLLSSSSILVSTFRIPNSQILELKAASHSFKVPVVYLSIYLSIYLIVSQAAFITHSITHSLTHFPTLQDLSDSDSDSDSGRLVNLFRSLLR